MVKMPRDLYRIIYYNLLSSFAVKERGFRNLLTYLHIANISRGRLSRCDLSEDARMSVEEVLVE